jgi:hypothetical protein
MWKAGAFIARPLWLAFHFGSKAFLTTSTASPDLTASPSNIRQRHPASWARLFFS